MGSWALIQGFLFLLLAVSSVATWIRLNKSPKDDPRLSRGLQILQSKISILEDLSDRTDHQVNQLMALLEQKVKEIQNQLLEADKTLQKIDGSMSRSLDVAKIFQDKIPHEEIIERQNTIKFIKAAKMAHEGRSIDEIMEEVDLNRGEAEFIAKVNRDQLQFSEEALPDWAKHAVGINDSKESKDSAESKDLAGRGEPDERSTALTLQSTSPKITSYQNSSLSELGEKFRQAVGKTDLNATEQKTAQESWASASGQPEAPAAAPLRAKPIPVKTIPDKIVRTVVFPRVDMSKNLS